MIRHNFAGKNLKAVLRGGLGKQLLESNFYRANTGLPDPIQHGKDSPLAADARMNHTGTK